MSVPIVSGPAICEVAVCGLSVLRYSVSLSVLEGLCLRSALLVSTGNVASQCPIEKQRLAATVDLSRGSVIAWRRNIVEVSTECRGI
jgi:hypothetical protein